MLPVEDRVEALRDDTRSSCRPKKVIAWQLNKDGARQEITLGQMARSKMYTIGGRVITYGSRIDNLSKKQLKHVWSITTD